MICAVLAVLLCLLQQVSDIEPPHLPHPPVFPFAPLGLPAAEFDAQWQRGAYMLLVRSGGR